MLDAIEEATRKKVCIAKLLMEKNYVDAVLMLYWVSHEEIRIMKYLGLVKAVCLTHYSSMFYFYTSCKRQKTIGFFDGLRGYTNGTLSLNGLISLTII